MDKINTEIDKYKKILKDLENKKQELLKKSFIATWIGKNKISRADYIRETSRENTDIFFWDDSNKGHAVSGGFFVFIDSHDNKPAIMKIYKIRTVTAPENRLTEWSNNGYTSVKYKTSHRKLLTIEKECLKTIDWRTYADAVGYRSHLQSTQPIRFHEMLLPL
jgi:hypothetical protein